MRQLFIIICLSTLIALSVISHAQNTTQPAQANTTQPATQPAKTFAQLPLGKRHAINAIYKNRVDDTKHSMAQDKSLEYLVEKELLATLKDAKQYDKLTTSMTDSSENEFLPIRNLLEVLTQNPPKGLSELIKPYLTDKRLNIRASVFYYYANLVDSSSSKLIKIGLGDKEEKVRKETVKGLVASSQANRLTEELLKPFIPKLKEHYSKSKDHVLIAHLLIKHSNVDMHEFLVRSHIAKKNNQKLYAVVERLNNYSLLLRHDLVLELIRVADVEQPNDEQISFLYVLLQQAIMHKNMSDLTLYSTLMKHSHPSIRAIAANGYLSLHNAENYTEGYNKPYLFLTEEQKVLLIAREFDHAIQKRGFTHAFKSIHPDRIGNIEKCLKALNMPTKLLLFQLAMSFHKQGIDTKAMDLLNKKYRASNEDILPQGAKYIVKHLKQFGIRDTTRE